MPARLTHPDYPVESHPELRPTPHNAPQPMDWYEAPTAERTPFNPTQEQLLAQMMQKSRVRLDREENES